MDIMAKAAFIASQVACMQARLVMMQEQNRCDLHDGRPVTYLPAEFDQLPDQFGLGHNTVLEYLQGN